MKHNIIFIEGLPGSGKSTFAKMLRDHYESLGYKVVQYDEKDLNPIDFTWCAILTREEYHELLVMYPQIKESIKKNTKEHNQHFIVAYTKVEGIHANIFQQQMNEKEISSINNIEEFKQFYLDIWNAFSYRYKSDTIYIFESVFLQNHINALLLKYDFLQKQITFYFQDLIRQLSVCKPVVFYIQEDDVELMLKRHTEERETSHKGQGSHWVDTTIKHLESYPLFVQKGYTGLQGAIQYFKERQMIELNVLNYIGTYKYIFKLNGKYDQVFEEMKKIEFE